MFISGAAVLLATGWIQPLDMLTVLMRDANFRLGFGGIAALIFLITLRLFVENFFKPRPTSLTIKETSLGDVLITLSTLENIVVRCAGKVKGIREIKPRLKITGDGLMVFVHTTISPEVSMPVVADELQQVIIETLDNIAGVKASEIKVFIDNLGQDKKNRLD
jgi:uncharacterized alkaline shock family protein YloU